MGGACYSLGIDSCEWWGLLGLGLLTLLNLLTFLLVRLRC